jgi:hypothetical protein
MMTLRWLTYRYGALACRYPVRCGNAFLPQLHGDLSFRIAADSRTELVLSGEYLPPLGRLGSLLDPLVGKRIAMATGKALLERIAADMELRERSFEAAPQLNIVS